MPLTNITVAVSFLLATNWMTNSIEKPLIPPVIPPNSFGLQTNILHQTGVVVSNVVVDVPWAGVTNEFTLQIVTLAAAQTRVITNVAHVYNASQF